MSRPTDLKVPPGACDCHMHIYDRRYPVASAARLTPPDASVTEYLSVREHLGLARTVAVTPSTYGTDNTSLVDALRQFGDTARGVAVVDAGISEADLRSLHAEGVRGVRFNLASGAAVRLSALEPVAERIAPLGWHVQLLLPADQLVLLESRLTSLPVPCVFDHLGRLPESGTGHSGFKVILRMLDSGRAWVKLSGAYLNGTNADGTYPGADSLALAYLRMAPERILWGTNWPHPTATAGQHVMPDDRALLELLARWTDSDQLFTRVLVDNPASLYGFTSN